MTVEGTRRARAAGLVRLGVARVRYRLLAGGTRQTLLSVLGVALAVTLVLSVTSVSLGLASQGEVRTEAADFWVVPAENQGSAIVGVEGTRFGQVHPVAERLNARDDVAHATPVLSDITRVRTGDGGEPTQVFVVGVIPSAEGGSVVGLPTDALSPGDPYYANGSYDGRWTGQAVLSESAATALNVSDGERLTAAGSDERSYQLRVEESHPAQAPGLAQFPVAVVHLSEAQRLTAAAGGDNADRFLVDSTDPAVREALTGLYPESEVVSQRGLMAHNLQTSDLPLAMSVAAGLIAVVAGVLTIVTTTGFEVADDGESRAVLAAMGVSRSTRYGLIVTETVATAAMGGLAGVLGWLAVVGVIAVAGESGSSVPTAVARPELAVYGLVLAVLVGLLSLPFLLLFTRRGSLVEALPR
ncbi:FtsX-like permease family protein [Halomicrobium salinisoli]|uniref:FtsX-like permease family protein n=1 Tax=Halomicrobium salinisoli TaxID=2878391 RepID=UPI001CF0D385|nr:ABC transporter permease [Halomicrobium salinisoli]